MEGVQARRCRLSQDAHLYLSCSRTLGDPELKLNPDRPILSNVPDSAAYSL